MRNIAATVNNWAYALQSTTIYPQLHTFVDTQGTSEFSVTASLVIQSNPVALIFVLVTVGLLGGMWTAPALK